MLSSCDNNLLILKSYIKFSMSEFFIGSYFDSPKDDTYFTSNK